MDKVRKVSINSNKEVQLFYFLNACENAWYLFINSFSRCVLSVDVFQV